ncbi:MAG: PQQ-like beta-propeller repeat protein [Planctomycetes bacterium]|nr:PQQ-like beta-propeller repeat protein [Planctomycetota bacterium]
MADLDLRALARAAAARPGDRAAGWAYASALARAGDRRGQARELCRLTRLGDADAQQALDAWSPWPGPDGLVLRRSLARAPRTLVERARVPLSAGRRAVVVAPQVVLTLGAHLEARALDDLALRWSGDPVWFGQAALVGDQFVAAAPDGLLTARDVLTGEVIVRCTLPDEVSRLIPALGARAVCAFGPTFGLIDLFPEAFGERAWELPLPHGASVSVGGRWVWLESGRHRQLIALDTGATVWARELWDVHLERSVALGLDDERLVAFSTDAPVMRHGTSSRLVQLSCSTLAVEWTREFDGGLAVTREGVALDEAWVMVATWEGDRLFAVLRATGEVRWTRALKDPSPALVLTPSILWVAERVWSEGAARIHVSGLEVATGQVRLEHVLLPVPRARRLRLAPCEGGVVLVTDDALIVLGEG